VTAVKGRSSAPEDLSPKTEEKGEFERVTLKRKKEPVQHQEELLLLHRKTREGTTERGAMPGRKKTIHWETYILVEGKAIL